MWPFDATECSDRDYDGVGDNADAFPDSAFEWLDSDGDGLGDNADVFPFDKDAKYDTDGDGVPDSTDLFPRNSGMDSFLDIGWRIGLGLLVVGGILFLIQRRNKTGHDELHWGQDTIESSSEESFNRPTSAPSLENFE